MTKLYLAGGWFNFEQEEEHTRLYNLLKDKYKVFNPKLESLIKPGCTDDFMSQTLLGNIEGIKNADIIVAIYDGKDTGTIWETGLAYAYQKPIIYYAEKLNGKKFNLMLAKTGLYAANETDLLNLLEDKKSYVFRNVYSSYKGDIE